MADSNPHVYLHFVWATKLRLPLITDDIEREVHRIIHVQADAAGSRILALNGMPDHIHLLVRYGCNLAFSQFMNQVKGASSRAINDLVHSDLPPGDPAGFRWQNGYGVFSIGRNQTDRAIAYIANQKQHHADGTIYGDWEPDD